jgi:hypothetical protein
MKVRYKSYFKWINERHKIYINKEVKKLPKSWTKDPILQRFKFCNVFRHEFGFFIFVFFPVFNIGFFLFLSNIFPFSFIDNVLRDVAMRINRFSLLIGGEAGDGIASAGLQFGKACRRLSLV